MDGDDHKADMESSFIAVLEIQSELRSFIESRIENPTLAALSLHLAAEAIIAKNDKSATVFDEMVPRIEAILDLGEDIVLAALKDGTYDYKFGATVEIAALEIAEQGLCRHKDCQSDYEDVELEVDPLDLN